MKGGVQTPPHLCVLYHSLTSPTEFHPLYDLHEMIYSMKLEILVKPVLSVVTSVIHQTQNIKIYDS